MKAEHYIYIFFFLILFFQSSGQVAFVKMYNFLQVMVLLKNAVCSNGICWNEKKKFLYLEEGCPEKKRKREKELCECHEGGVDRYVDPHLRHCRDSSEVKSPHLSPAVSRLSNDWCIILLV